MWLRRLMRTAVSTLLAASGLLSIAAARQRWWPACRLGDFDAPDCLTRQGHVYDFVPPTAPWVAAGSAAELVGVALLLLAAAVALLPVVLGGGHARTLTLSLSAAAALGLLTVAAAAWLSGKADTPVAALAPVFWFFYLGWPIILFTMALLYVRGTQDGIRSTLLFFALLIASTPIATILLAPLSFGYSSYDTTPWSEAVSGALLVAAAIALWPASRRQPLPTAGAVPAKTQPRNHSPARH